MKKIINFFISNPLIVNVITLFILFAGLLSFQNLNKQAYPMVDEGGVTIKTLYPGASPEDVELNVTIPIEDELKTIEYIKEYYSYSFENYSLIHVRFDPEESAKFEKIKIDILRCLDSITDFPEEVTEKPEIKQWGLKYEDALDIGIRGDNIEEKDLQLKVKELKAKILNSPYIAKVDEVGMRDREVQVKINVEKMNANYLSFEDIINAVKNHNIHVTNGTLKSYTSEKNIVTLSQFDDVMDVEDVIIRSNFAGNKIKLSDIAEVNDTFEKEREKHRFNGTQGIKLEVYKRFNSDAIKTSDSVKKIINKFNKDYKKEGVNAVILLDDSDATRKRLGVLLNNALLGLVFVLIVLFLFLNFKNAFWTAVGIPFSICFCFIFLPVFNVTINSISLLGMIIVLGMIVDDAIIISENINRHKLFYKKGLASAVEAVKEVWHSVLTTILTTIIAFLPLIFMKGISGDYAREIPIIISLVLIGSLLESLFILPAHVAHDLNKPARFVLGLFTGVSVGYIIAKYFSFSSIYFLMSCIVSGIISVVIFLLFYKEDSIQKEKWIIRIIKKIYSKLLNPVLKLRWVMVVLFFLMLGCGLFLMTKLKFELFPSVEPDQIIINGEVAKGNSLEYTEDKIKPIENYIRNNFNNSELYAVMTQIGEKGYNEKFTIVLMLTTDNSRKLKADYVSKKVEEKMKKTGEFKKLEFKMENIAAHTSDNKIVIEVAGNDDKNRKHISDIVADDLNQINGIKNILRDDSLLKDEIKIIPQYDKVSQYGVTAYSISNVLKIAYDGYIVTDIQTPEEKIPYRILLKDKYRKKLSTLNSLKVLNRQNKLVPVRQMVDIKEGKALTEINHYNGVRTTKIRAQMDTDYITPGELYDRLHKKYEDLAREYNGIQIKLGGDIETTVETENELRNMMIISLIAIFALLIFLFRSLTQPVIIILIIPFGIIGVIITFLMHGMVLSMMGMLGLIGLSGVIINDALVMVEYSNQLRQKYPDNKMIDIVKEAAVTRLQPILLTSITTFCGLIPTAYGLGGRDILIMPAAMALSWGLLFGTFINLFILPVFQMLESDIKKLFLIILPGIGKKK